MNQKYYLKTGFNNSLSLTLILPLLILIWAPLINYVVHEHQGVYFVTMTSLMVVFVVFIGRKRVTGIELTEEGFRLNYFLWLGMRANFSSAVKRVVRWDQVQGIMISHGNFSHKKSTVAKIILHKTNGIPPYVMLYGAAFEKGNELFEYLRNKLPAIRNDHELFSDLLRRPVSYSSIQYKDLTLTENGIKQSEKLIPWSRIRTINYEDYNRHLNGLGAINVTYEGRKDVVETMRILPKQTEQFRTFLIYLIKKAHNASIDSSLLKLFDKQHQREALFIKIFIFLFAIVLFSLLIKIFILW